MKKIENDAEVCGKLCVGLLYVDKGRKVIFWLE